jgi:hypothetical protein
MVLSNASFAHSSEVETVGTLEIGVADLATSTYRFGSIPSNAKITEILLYTDVLDSGAGTFAVDIGLYETTVNGSAVVDADFFASAVLGLVTAINGTKVAFEALDIAKAEQAIWQILALASDPNKRYDVVATATGDSDTAGTMTLKIRYTI